MEGEKRPYILDSTSILALCSAGRLARGSAKHMGADLAAAPRCTLAPTDPLEESSEKSIGSNGAGRRSPQVPRFGRRPPGAPPPRVGRGAGADASGADKLHWKLANGFKIKTAAAACAAICRRRLL